MSSPIYTHHKVNGTPVTSFSKSHFLLPLLLFISIFIFYTYPMGLSDYWWHMSSGRWIWENMALPNVDQFTYSYAKDADTRRTVILQAYYLGQVSFYFIYIWFGIWGLLLYKASLLTLPLWLLWRYLRFKNIDSSIALILLLPLPLLLHRFDELRAVVFSFIGAIAILYLIELLLDRLRNGKDVRLYFILLPATMLLWANLHRGFLIGWVLLAAYLGSELLKFLRHKKGLNRDALSRHALITFTLLSVLAVLISLVNPNGLGPIVANSSELSGPFMQVIDEYFPLWKYANLYEMPWIFYAALAIVLFGGLFMFLARKKLQWAHAVLFVGFAYQGLITFRFSYFLVIMCIALAAPYYQSAGQRLVVNYSKQVRLFALLLFVAVSGVNVQRSAFLSSPWERQYFPSAATQYILQNRPPTKLFNAFEYGGYLGWKLYPEYKIFIDQRNLDYAVYQEYGQARRGDYKTIFAKYDVKTVLFYIQQPVLNRVPRIVAELLKDPDWVVVFVDPVAIIFVNKNSQKTAAKLLPILNNGQVIEFINRIIANKN